MTPGGSILAGLKANELSSNDSLPADLDVLDSVGGRFDAGQRQFSQAAVRRLAGEAGFLEAGVTGVAYGEAGRDAERFAQFIDEGRAAGMTYLERRDGEGALIRGRVETAFPWAKSVVVCLAGYHPEAPLSTEADGGDEASGKRRGWIARYALSGKRDGSGALKPSDYHRVLKRRLEKLEAGLHAEFGEFECRAYVDTGPVAERAVARAAGVGWTGKNTCLIHPGLGSWNFLAVLVTSLGVESQPLTIPDRCGSCTRCLEACPTGALTEPYRMDAGLCISYLTIEHGGAIAPDLRGLMGRQVFGCDICQDVCPWNRKAPIAVDSELETREELVNPELGWLAELSLEDFERLFNGSPVRRAGYAGLRRNVAMAMGNSGWAGFLPLLRRLAEAEPAHSGGRDERNTGAVGAAARWAIERLEG